MWWRSSSRLCQVSLKPLWWLQWHQTPRLDTWSLCLLYFGSCLATGCQTCWQISISCLILLKFKCDLYCFATAEGEESIQLLGMKRGVCLCFDWSRVSLPEVNECMYCQCDDCVFVRVDRGLLCRRELGGPSSSVIHPQAVDHKEASCSTFLSSNTTVRLQWSG